MTLHQPYKNLTSKCITVNSKSTGSNLINSFKKPASHKTIS